MSGVGGPDGAPLPRPPVPPLRRNRDFLLLWLGAGVSVLGDRVATVAFPLLMVWYGGSTTDAGLVGFAGLLPMLLLQLPAGVVVDRLDRRRTMIVCDLAGLLAMASVAVALACGALWLPHMLAVAFVEGTAAIFYRLSERAAVRNVVHESHLSAALSQNEARARAAALFGQPLGSSLYGVAKWFPFLFAAASHVVALAGLLMIRKKFQAERAADTPWRLRAEVAEGFGWLWGQPFLRAAISLVAVTNILFQALSLALVLIIKESGGSPATIGLIGLVSGIGGIAGALTGSRFVQRLNPGTVMIAIFAVWAALMPLVALTSQVLPLAAVFAGTSFAGAILNVMAGVYQVRTTPDHMQGRVGAVAGLLSSGASSLGALAGGFALTAVGSTTTVLGVAAVMLATLVAAVLIPAVRGARRVPDQDVPAGKSGEGAAEPAGSSSDSAR
ncbi:MFS transporter [Streptomyces sp. F63]|uniref:MFS transporter n=1 Tax=Streptomyces sp. F63 TaxID=2824887 RepID=UPI001B62C791|nr:MFS transporter [Streptomyces sp. F63]MBQ0984631.1 MFS transporter [Streptomyces sp. F63]